MKQQSKETVLTLANANALVVGIVGNVAGTEVASTLNGNPVTKQALTDLVDSHMRARLNFETFVQPRKD